MFKHRTMNGIMMGNSIRKTRCNTDLTCRIGCNRAGSKFREDLRSSHTRITCALSSIMLSCSATLITNGPLALPLEIRVLAKTGRELYDSSNVPRMTASVTRTASLTTKTLSGSPSGPSKSFRTGCRASFAEKSLSFFPCTSRFSSLFHLKHLTGKSLLTLVCR